MTTSLLMSKMFDISDARRRVNHTRVARMEDHDKRREFRRESSERLFVQIVTSEDRDLIGTTISCEAVDISASGLQIRTQVPIPVGCRLDLWVDNRASPGKFFLSSDVRWVAPVVSGFLAGVELKDSPATDIEEWQRSLAKR
jgi:hypothetical protein